MPTQDAATILEGILGEAETLIRQRLKERGLELPHLVIAVTSDGQVVLRSNGGADVLRSFGKDLQDVAHTRISASASKFTDTDIIQVRMERKHAHGARQQ